MKSVMDIIDYTADMPEDVARDAVAQLAIACIEYLSMKQDEGDE